MPYELYSNPIFESDRQRLLKNRPLAKSDVEAALKSFTENPSQGDRLSGIGLPEVRKARWPLKAYQIGRSGGLRIVYFVQEEKRLIVPLTLWQKKEMTNERDVVALVKRRFQETIAALKALK